MPELPEVETVVRGLNRTVKDREIVDVWTDWSKYSSVKKCVVGKKILKAERKGKNILINLSDKKLLLIHQKMTGHLLYGRWSQGKKTRLLGRLGASWEKEKWIPDPPVKFLTDSRNKFLRLIFFLDNDKMLALSDMRRFAKVICGAKKEILEKLEKELGPEPLDITFTEFKKLFKNKRGQIKSVLMDQSFIVGVGNIYSDEILYLSKIHPLSRVENLNNKQLKILYDKTIQVFKKAIKSKGTSINDFRDIKGRKGKYADELLVYQKHKEKCPKGHKVNRIKIGGRSAHFCSKEQKIY